MKKSNVVDNRRFKLEDIKKKDYIPFLGGRPERIKVIQHDDILNLSIALNTEKSFEKFLKNI
jgi:hypothetical protein